MIVTTIKGFTNVLGQPENWNIAKNGTVGGLPVRIEAHGDTISCTSAWKPSPDELAALLAGSNINLRVIGGQPPVSIFIDGVEEDLQFSPPGPEDRRTLLMMKALRLCGAQFQNYADQHAAKRTAEGDAKAATNREYAKLCGDVLQGLGPAADGYADAFYDLAKMMGIGARANSPATIWETEMRPKLAALLGPASVVGGVDRVGLVNQDLDSGNSGAVFDFEKGAARAPGSTVKPDLPIGHIDDLAARGTDDLSQDVVEIGASHGTVIPYGIESCHPESTERTFQTRVGPWLLECFGEMIAGDREERNHRFLEEALELVQACGCTASEAHQLVDYVFDRLVGDPAQEVGGVMVTLAALCLANGLDMHRAGEIELARIWAKVDAIRAKQAAKPRHSPLPEKAARPEDDALIPHLPEHLSAERRCGIQRSAWLTGWFVPWSPRNDNENAEGPWSHWVDLAHKIIEADKAAIAALVSTKTGSVA
ncbi:hypothetical protein [Sphingomonas abietis]|uniref:Uncharacterized protein n=1 Tax=Sphingomonas abietis TaxID=3012344 RepID=A0ABY7NR18_9SPHN|nr:hypothetical protein [Sphingomonas abietis]WBO23980.1 hypothetical protein PBT88_07675 [Sphingomonas abietis]